MIEYSLKTINADELSFKVNPIRTPPQNGFQIKPRFARSVRIANENPAIHLLMLECVIAGTEESPTPFNLTARFVGVFEVKNVVTEDDRRTFVFNATETVFPYLRAAVTNLTADALAAPIVLPVISASTLFPDGKGQERYTLNFDPKIVN